MKNNRKEGNLWYKKIIFLIILIFLSSCNNIKNTENKYKKISKIPEASGICYMKKTEIFFVANDEWKIFKIDKNGKKLKEKNIWNYDFEWIVCNQKNNEIYLLIEDTWNLLKINSENLEISWDFILDLDEKDRKKFFNKKSWAEWLAYNWEYFYISTQNNKNNLLKFKIKKDKKNLKLEKVFNIESKDLSWLTFYKKDLYILSDKNDKIYKYNTKKEKIIKTRKVDLWAWEWIVFDENWKIFLADDNWEVVIFWKF